MRECANSDREWGAKAMFFSAFRHHGALIDAHLERIQEGEFKGYARLAAATLKMALLDAEAEVTADPDSVGPEQQMLLSPPDGEMLIRTKPDDGSEAYYKGRTAWTETRWIPTPDVLDAYLQCLSIDSAWFLKTSSYILDQVADRIRAERTQPSAKVICITEARQRREAAAELDALFVYVPVRSRGHEVGQQLAWNI